MKLMEPANPEKDSERQKEQEQETEGLLEQESSEGGQVEKENQKEELETELGRFAEEKQQELQEMRGKMRDLPDDPLERAEVFKEIDEFLKENLGSVEFFPQKVGKDLEFESIRNFTNSFYDLKEQYTERVKEYKEELPLSRDIEDQDKWRENKKEREEKINELRGGLEQEQEKIANQLRDLKQEKSGLLGRWRNKELLSQVDELLSKKDTQDPKEFLEEAQEADLLSGSDLDEFRRLQAEKERAQERVELAEKKLEDMKLEWQEKSAHMQEQIEPLLAEYENFLKELEAAEQREVQAREFIEQTVYPELGVDRQSQEEYSPQTELEQEVPREDIERSFENARNMTYDYLRYWYRQYKDPENKDLSGVFRSLQECIEKTRESYRCELNTSGAKLQAILEQGKFASFWELSEEEQKANSKTLEALGGAMEYQRNRQQAEEQMETENPIYAALSTDNPYDAENGPAPNYGDAVVRFKDSVLERSRFVLGDSMNAKLSLVEPFDVKSSESKWHQLDNRKLLQEHAVLGKAMYDHYFQGGDPKRSHYSRTDEGQFASLQYIETHVNNGASVEEIDTIIFTGGDPGEEVKQQLEEKGINFEVR